MFRYWSTVARALTLARELMYIVLRSKPSIQRAFYANQRHEAPVSSLCGRVCYSASAWSKEATISTFRIGKVNF